MLIQGEMFGIKENIPCRWHVKVRANRCKRLKTRIIQITQIILSNYVSD